MKILTVLLLLPLWAAAENISIRLENGAYRVDGWTPVAQPDGWDSVLQVYAGPGDLPPMLGSYAIERGALVFRPRFPAAGGVVTKAVFRVPGGPAAEAVFVANRLETARSTKVEQIYPTTGLLPDNQLKFYVQFSAPMSRGEAWRRIHLLDEVGKPVELPFLEVEQELWDREYKRFTILFDPGRIKRGLFSLRDAGPAIEEGKSYTLVIDKDWQDGRGAPLREGFRKSFRVGPADRAAIDPQKWKITTPKAGSTEALVVDFPKPLDWALLHRLLSIRGLSGQVAVDRNETEWRFTPNQPWKAGEYNLDVDTSLEDLAGNRLGRAFDVDTFERISAQIVREKVSIPVRIGQNKR